MARRPKNDPSAPELDRSSIVRASILLIDRDGLESFSLRKLARHLGAGNMSVYYYVKDRDELLALVLDEVLGGIDLGRLPADPIDAVGALARRFVAAFTAHPQTIPLFALHPILRIGPNGARIFDTLIELLQRTELDDYEVADTTVALVEYLCGHLIGHLPQVRQPHETYGAIVDDVLDHLPDGQAPNLEALAPALRRAADDLARMPGVEMILAGIRTGPSRSRRR